jgi:hypothetical protein
MVRSVLTQLGALAALAISVVLAGDLDRLLDSPLKALFVAISVLIAIAAAVWEVVGTHRSRPIRYRGKRRNAKILRYMTKLLAAEGQCVVSTNDLSWVTGSASDALFEKAKSGSLVLVMPQSNEIGERLEHAGAKAYYYGDEEFKFSSRFTLVNPARADTWVAVGHGTKGAHTIREAHSKDDPVVHLAKDLFQLAKRNAKDRGRS